MARLNARFRSGRPSNILNQTGIILHQFDGLETDGAPYRMCIERCQCQGMQLHGRISSSIISAALHERRDRRAVPLPFGSRGGLLINPNAAQVSCLYGIDGRTIDYGPSWEDSSTVPPGCSRSRCKRSDGLGQEGWRYDGWHGMTGRCGFDGQPAIAWSPSEMDMLLQAHLEHGVPWTQVATPAFEPPRHSPSWRGTRPLALATPLTSLCLVRAPP